MIESDGSAAGASSSWMLAQAQVHVRACPGCQAWRRSDDRLTNALEQVADEPLPPRFKENVMARIQASARPTVLKPERTVDVGWWKRPAFAAQGLAAAASVLLFFTPAGRIVLSGMLGIWRAGQDTAAVPATSDGTQTLVNIAGKLAGFDAVWIVILFGAAMLVNRFLLARNRRLKRSR